ncbi:phospholipase ABHD3-like [Mytilus galloprovincialis]|uniref:Phospholipase ABHD3 n=1 Tax=Mytilus galloprovincialis TaxID=29158 RepID=A0A8B6F8I8_MYTGA|nr:abhydrolase domain-containing protein 1/3 [Mytilus galloprovincialis]
MDFGALSEFCRENASILIALTFIILYICYYYLFVVKKPQIACKDQKFKSFLLEHCPVLSSKFKPTIWCFESRAQTILRSFIPTSIRITYDAEIITLSDGGQIILDWYENENPMFPDKETRPTILLLPGLTGDSSCSYILHLVSEAAQHGYRSVVFNQRGNGGAKLKTPRTYCAANTEDLAHVVNIIKGRLPQAPIIGVGVSLGGMQMLNYLARSGDKSQLEAGMCISVAWNVFESVESLEKPGLNLHVINRQLSKTLVQMVQSNMEVFENHFDNLDHILKSSTIREFDERFTSKIFGYDTWQDYYKEACLHDKIHALKVPVLVLNAADDPFSPHHAIPVKEAEENENIAIVVTSHGGHIGFMEGFIPRNSTFMDKLFSQYVKAVVTHGPTHLKQE